MSGSASHTALITGGSKGIGKATGHALAKAGVTVGLSARDPEALEAAAQEIRDATGGRVEIIPADLSTAEGVAEAVRVANEKLDHVDILVNVAGAAPPGTVEELTDEQWDVAIDLKFRGYVRLMRALLPGMKERGFGRVINVAGNAGKQPGGWLVSSGTVNAAIMALTRAVGSSIAASGVTVNAVCPGPTATDRWDGMQKVYAETFNKTPEQAAEELVSGIPAGRVATSEEIAHSIAFFASEEARHITGESLMVDGGQVRCI